MRSRPADCFDHQNALYASYSSRTPIRPRGTGGARHRTTPYGAGLRTTPPEFKPRWQHAQLGRQEQAAGTANTLHGRGQAPARHGRSGGGCYGIIWLRPTTALLRRRRAEPARSPNDARRSRAAKSDHARHDPPAPTQHEPHRRRDNRRRRQRRPQGATTHAAPLLTRRNRNMRRPGDAGVVEARSTRQGRGDTVFCEHKRVGPTRRCASRTAGGRQQVRRDGGPCTSPALGPGRSRSGRSRAPGSGILCARRRSALVFLIIIWFFI